MSAAEVDAYIRNRGALYGTASAIEVTLEEFVDAGCSGFMIFCNNTPAPDSLDQLASTARTRSAARTASPDEFWTFAGPHAAGRAGELASALAYAAQPRDACLRRGGLACRWM
jgi:hypothetical protein